MHLCGCILISSDGITVCMDAAPLDGPDQEVLKALLIQLRHTHQVPTKIVVETSRITPHAGQEGRSGRSAILEYLRREVDRKEENAARWKHKCQLSCSSRARLCYEKTSCNAPPLRSQAGVERCAASGIAEHGSHSWNPTISRALCARASCDLLYMEKN